ncbi:MAG: four helix bundle protein [Candidatus Magasanikbacteria bacterium]
MKSGKIESFTDLKAWEKGHNLVISIYDVVSNFPKSEEFGLSSQMRRAVVSITSNIAEGFSRKSYKEKVNFYSMSLGSTTELQNQLLVAKDVGYLSKSDFEELSNKTVEVHKLINGLIKSSKQKTRNS